MVGDSTETNVFCENVKQNSNQITTTIFSLKFPLIDIQKT